jgi:hypothetical protein
METIMTSVLIAWWGAMKNGGETIGDVRAVRNVAHLVRDMGFDFAIATDCPYDDLTGLPLVDWREEPPERWNIVIFVCGPVIGTAPQFISFIERYQPSIKVGLGVSLLPVASPGAHNPFDFILVRDGGDRATWGDLALPDSVAPRETIAPRPVGLCLRGLQGEYGPDACLDEQAGRLAHAIAAEIGGEIVTLDTRLKKHLSICDAIIRDFDRCGTIITTRMHGGMLALVRGIPFVAIDQVRGGAKVTGVLQPLGWKLILPAETTPQSAGAEVVRKLTAPDILQDLRHAQRRNAERYAAAMAAARNLLHRAEQAVGPGI